MRVLPKRSSRTAWVVITNGLMLFLLLNGRPGVSNSVVAGLLSVGILLELVGSAAAALLNVVSFLYGPFGWLWERTHDANFQDHSGEYSLTLVVFVIPCLAIIAVNLVFYVPPLLRWRRSRRCNALPNTISGTPQVDANPAPSPAAVYETPPGESSPRC